MCGLDFVRPPSLLAASGPLLSVAAARPPLPTARPKIKQPDPVQNSATAPPRSGAVAAGPGKAGALGWVLVVDWPFIRGEVMRMTHGNCPRRPSIGRPTRAAAARHNSSGPANPHAGWLRSHLCAPVGVGGVYSDGRRGCGQARDDDGGPGPFEFIRRSFARSEPPVGSRGRP